MKVRRSPFVSSSLIAFPLISPMRAGGPASAGTDDLGEKVAAEAVIPLSSRRELPHRAQNLWLDIFCYIRGRLR
jgi:hypothetical protein